MVNYSWQKQYEVTVEVETRIGRHLDVTVVSTVQQVADLVAEYAGVYTVFHTFRVREYEAMLPDPDNFKVEKDAMDILREAQEA